MLAKKWLENAREIMVKIEETQMENIHQAAAVMADSIEAGRWVHTFGCGHSTLPVEEMYPRIGGFVGFHPIIELPLSFFTHIVGDAVQNKYVVYHDDMGDYATNEPTMDGTAGAILMMAHWAPDIK
jgi:uncharacterized phosphosugar-binding protein